LSAGAWTCQHTPGVRRRPGPLNIVNIGGDNRFWLPPPAEYVIAFAFLDELAIDGTN